MLGPASPAPPAALCRAGPGRGPPRPCRDLQPRQPQPRTPPAHPAAPGRGGSDIGAREPPREPPRAHAWPLERASEQGWAQGKDFELSIERVSVLFLIKSFFKWWRWPKFHTVKNKERRKRCVGAARARGQAGGAREAQTQANTLAVRGNIFCF